MSLFFQTEILGLVGVHFIEKEIEETIKKKDQEKKKRQILKEAELEA